MSEKEIVDTENHPLTEYKAAIELLQAGEIKLAEVPIGLVDRNLYVAAMKAEHDCIKNIDDFLRSDELWSETISFNPSSIVYMSKSEDKDRILISAISAGLVELNEIPDSSKTFRVCIAACKKNPEMIFYSRSGKEMDLVADWLFNNGFLSEEKFDELVRISLRNPE